MAGFPDPLKKVQTLVDADRTPTGFFVQQWNLLLAFVKSTLADITGLILRVARLEAVTISTTAPITGGGSILNLSAIAHANSAVTPGSYLNANITVDQKGHVTAASTGGGGGGGAWSLVASHNFTATPQATWDVPGITGTDILVIGRGLTLAVSGVRIVRVSTDNGATFFSTSGDYMALSNLGVEDTTLTALALHTTGSASARSGALELPAAGLTGVPHISRTSTQNGDPATTRWFTTNQLPINAVRLLGSAGGNITGGIAYVLQRG